MSRARKAAISELRESIAMLAAMMKAEPGVLIFRKGMRRRRARLKRLILTNHK